MPGTELTMFQALEDEMTPRLTSRLPDLIWNAVGRAFPEKKKYVDVRWLNPIRGDRSRNATAAHLTIEYSAQDGAGGLPSDMETLRRVAEAVLTMFEERLPSTFLWKGRRRRTSYDIWIKAFGKSAAKFGAGEVGKGFWLVEDPLPQQDESPP